jgi:hypothetical protein
MVTDIWAIYQDGYLELPRIPPRSRLYHLQPLGLGTSLTESLTSYLTRLAAAHCVSVRKLFVHEMMPLLHRSYSLSSIAEMMSHFSYLVNGVDSHAQAWSGALESLTQHRNLRPLTMLTWSSLPDTFDLTG